MATKQKSSTSRTSARSGSSTRASARPSSRSKSTTRRSATTTRSSARPSGAKQSGKGRTPARSSSRSAAPGAVSQALAGHRHDMWGVALIALGLLTALGVYGDLAGPLGRGLADAFGAAFGTLRIMAAPVLVMTGAMLLRGPTEAVTAASHRAVRLVIGTFLIFTAIDGLLFITHDRPSLGAPLEAVIAAGGYLGITVGTPLVALLAPWGAGLVMVALAVIGLVLTTGVSVRTFARRTADGVRPVQGVLRRGVDSLFEVGAGSGPAPTEDGPVFIDSTTGESEADPIPVDEGGLQTIDEGDDLVLVAGSDDEPPVEELEVHLPDADDAVGGEQLVMPIGPAAKPVIWKLPPLKMLERSKAQEVNRSAVEARGKMLEAALAEHGVQTRLVGMVVGPTVTRYELELAAGVKVAKVTSLHKDIAYSMATPDVRILAPIPGKQAIGVEVPNDSRQLVAVGDILSSPEAKAAKNPLEVAIGRDINGRAVLADLSKMPHILIAGATGAGKSSCINSLLTSILMRSTPDQVRLILIDPKRVELGQYNRLPHLLTQVVTNPKKAANALAWTVKEMERRYDLLSEVGFRDIDGYNTAYDRGELIDDPDMGVEFSRLPYILVVVDELNDLMMVAARDVEESICRIAQMARAVGIHLVIATQRPSVNVITGVIKANVPARLAFAVSSLADSRVILDQGGAEKLLGRGDMLLLGPSSSIAQRIQGAWVTEEEVRAVVAAWRKQSPQVAYDDSVQGSEESTSSGSGGAGSADGDDDDDLLLAATELVVRSQLGSTSMLQRKLRVGFARAGRLMDLLEQRGVVGPSEGSKARAVLITPEEFDAGVTGTK
ncbi:MAG: DNA translocase FtsK [Acidobacteria bacterium]|nr:DNA translocase FtsK [Acidobacteriota bacterium]